MPHIECGRDIVCCYGLGANALVELTRLLGLYDGLINYVTFELALS